MAKVYRGQVKSINNNTYVAELWQGTDTSGSFTDLNITKLNIEWQGENGKFFENSIMPSRCTVGFTSRETSGNLNNSVQATFELIATDEESKWSLVIKKNGSLHWVGRVLADQMQFLRTSAHGFVCELTAVDALSLIQGFDVDETFFTGNEITAAQMIRKCLDKANLKQNWINATADYLNDAIEHDNANQDSLLNIAFYKLNRNSFINEFDIDSGNIKYVSCKDAIEGILKTFGARMFLSNGQYWIVQANSYDTTNLTFDTYDTTLSYESDNNTLAHAVTVNASSRPAWEAKPTVSYQPPVRKVTVKIRRRNGNIGFKTIYNTTMLSLNGRLVDGKPIKAIFNYQTETYMSSTSQPTRLVYFFKLYVWNSTSNTYYYWNAATQAWASASLGSINFDYETQYSGLNTLMGGAYKITKVLPPPPSGVDYIYLDAKVTKQKATVSIVKSPLIIAPVRGVLPPKITWGSPANDPGSFKGTVGYTQAYNTTEPYEFEQTSEFSSSIASPRDTNSTAVTIDIPYYNGNINDFGNIFVWSGSAYVAPGAWSVGWTANTGDLPQVLARQITALYRDFVPQIRGILRDAGNYNAVNSLSFDNGKWLFNGGTFDAQTESWDGQWLKLINVFTNVTDDGEGQSVRSNEDKLFDKIREVEDRLNYIAADANQVGLRFIDDVLTMSDTADPSADVTWVVKMDYDNTDQNVTFNLDNRVHAIVDVNTITSTPYTALTTDRIILVNIAGTSTVNLPTASGNKNLQYTIKKIYNDANAVTIDGNGSETIDGQTTYLLGAVNDFVTIVSDGANWQIISK